jgi:hypothetical protein
MRFAKITLYVGVQDYRTSVETDKPLPFDVLDYVMPALEASFDDDPDLILLDSLSDDMRLVPAERS